MWHRLFSAIVAILLPVIICLGQETNPLRTELLKIIQRDTDISFDDVPGFIINIVDGDSIFSEGFGTFGNMDPDSLQNLVFELGGLSKVFTVHIAERLIEEGKLTYESLLTSYFQDHSLHSSLSKVTLGDLVWHTSGFPQFPENESEDPNKPIYQHYQPKDLLNYLKKPQSQRRGYSYSHLNYVILQWCLERASGMTYQELLARYMISSWTSRQTSIASKDKLNTTPGFDRAGREAPASRFEYFFASEGILSSAGDLTRMMHYYLSSSEGQQLLKRMSQPVKKIPGGRKSMVAHGWHLFKNKKYHDIYLHSGRTIGHAASIHFISETKTAVILLTNSPGRLYGLGTLVLRMINNNWKR